jgi:hypothetical protein
MKPRILKTTKILSIAIPLAAGCSSSLTAEKPLPVQAVRDDVPAAVAPRAPLPPVPDPNPNPRLLALRDELAPKTEAEVRANQAHFRPLCDKDGYPLVGNLARKAPDYQVSTFCSELRALPIR